MRFLKNYIFSLILVPVICFGLVERELIRTIPNCSNFDQDEIEAFIKNDFLINQLPNWRMERDMIGTLKPSVWILPESVNGQSGKWHAQLKARGINRDHLYGVTVDCQQNKISYKVLSKTA